MSEESQGASAARRRRLRARGRIARRPPPRTDDVPRRWPRRLGQLLALLVVLGVGYSQRTRLASLWGSARNRVAALMAAARTDDPVEFDEGMEFDVPEFDDTPPPTRDIARWPGPTPDPTADIAPFPGPPRDPTPDVAPFPGPPRDPTPDIAPIPGPSPTPAAPDPTPTAPSPTPDATRLAGADPDAPDAPEAGKVPWRTRAGDLWTRLKAGLRTAADLFEKAVEKVDVMLGGTPTTPSPSPSPSQAPLDPDYDPFAPSDGPTAAPTPTSRPTPEASPTASPSPTMAPIDPDRDPFAPTRSPEATSRPPVVARRPTDVAPSPWSPRLAGADGQRLELPSGVRLDLHPFTRYKSLEEEVVLLSGGALVQLPPGGGAIRLTGGVRLEGEDALFEVSGVQSAGTVDTLVGRLTLIRRGRVDVPLHPLERRYLDEDLAEPLPPAEAGTFVRRLAWFASYPRRERAATVALELAEQLQAGAQGTSREPSAQAALEAALSWAERMAQRRRLEATARL